MAFKCKHRWNSFVKDEPDDEIEVLTETGGALTGLHHRPRPTGDIAFTGTCSEGPPHHMNIMTDENIEYDGDIHEPRGQSLLIVVGTRTQWIIDKDGKRKKANGDDVWVGVKTGT